MRLLNRLRWLPLLACVVAAGCSGEARTTLPAPTASLVKAEGELRELPSSGFFADVATASGIQFTFRNGEQADYFTFLETLGGGVAILDYDRDGLMDVFLIGGGSFTPEKAVIGAPSRLYRNEGGWRFRDVTTAAGLDQPLFYSQGCAVGDYDNDGWPDLLVTGYGRMALYHNESGTFREMTKEAGLLTPGPLHWSTSAAWGDFNEDGWLDLFVVHYVDWSFQNHPRCPGYHPGQPVDTCTPRAFQALPDYLYLNQGNGQFRDASREAGLRLDHDPGKGLGVMAADFNEDGKLDVYVANDTTPNHLYLNRGGGQFDEVGLAMGVANGESGKPDGSMGVDAADFDGSGRLSIFVTNFQGELHALYRSTGAGRPYHHASTRTGIAALGQRFVGFGTMFLDYDLDGAEDIIISNGHTARSPPPPVTLPQRLILLRNLRRPGDRPADVRFGDVSTAAGPFFWRLHRGRGLSLADLDNDGRIDVVLNHCEEPTAVLRNELNNGHHWLGITLVGKPQPDAIGAVATLEVGSQRLVRVRKGGTSYLSASDPRLLFGLGPAQEVGKLTVRWPSGRVQTWQGLEVDRYWRLAEGEEKPL